MPVQSPQDCSGIGAAAAQARLGGNALGDSDGHALRVPFGRPAEHLRRLPGQVAAVLRYVLFVAGEGPGLCRAHLHLHIIPDGDGLHHRLNVMVTIGPLAQHIQCQIDFGKRAFAQCHTHLMVLPSR